MIDMHGCKETARRWPDTFDEVSPDELDDFIAHAEGCAYHTAALRAAEEELLPRARAARALSADGSILVGKKSARAVAENRRLMERWHEVAAKRELPFCRIALRHGDHEIARCDNFLDLINHDAVHELDADVCLEVWGIITGDGVKVEARLGTYDLDRDPAKGEKFYEVGNGYKVGLQAQEVGGETFKVQFRCVESEKLTRAQAGEQKAQAAAASGGTAPISGDAAPGRKRPATRAVAEPKHRRPRAWPRLPPSWQPSVKIALGLLLVVAAVTIAKAIGLSATQELQRVAGERHQQEEAERLERLSELLGAEQIQLHFRNQATSASTKELAEIVVELSGGLKDYSMEETNVRSARVLILPSPASTRSAPPPRVSLQPPRDAQVGEPTGQSGTPRTDAASGGGRAGGMM